MSPVSVRARPSLEPLADRLVPAVMPLAPGAFSDPPAIPSQPAQPAILTPGTGDFTDAGGLKPPVVSPQSGPGITTGLTVYQVPPDAGLVPDGWTPEEPTFNGGLHVG